MNIGVKNLKMAAFGLTIDGFEVETFIKRLKLPKFKMRACARKINGNITTWQSNIGDRSGCHLKSPIESAADPLRNGWLAGDGNTGF